MVFTLFTLHHLVHVIVDTDGLYFFVLGPLMVPDLAPDSIHNETIHAGFHLLFE